MSIQPLATACLLLGTLVAAGCTPSDAPTDPDSPTPDAAVSDTPASDTPAPDSAAAAAAIAPKLASLEEVQKHIQSLGRPAVVDYWSLACQPCMDEFPGLVRLHEQHGERVACMAVDVDFDGRKSKPPESYQEAVTAFLTEQQATFPSYICTTPSEDVYASLEIDSIPTVFVFAADGTVAKKFVDAGDTAGFSYADDVMPFVEQMLAETP
ncbi:TlpA family protein disulfide reductase [Roseimaritima ulvae]|uniref:Thiol-disulfide oxidoreductase n=1 Tax=Roseimaritima ulvae TaxID=980254 RepID=A0A5B9QHS6_9BACT|nr:TlpA disulfide reductase family protein [Roseimaritima ulvae]QEG38677.1 thiol-disulfide oxidoreductase [Roseimaritima ulvae]